MTVRHIGKTVLRIGGRHHPGLLLAGSAKWGSPSHWPPITWVNHLLLVKQRLPFALPTFELLDSDFSLTFPYSWTSAPQASQFGFCSLFHQWAILSLTHSARISVFSCSCNFLFNDLCKILLDWAFTSQCAFLYCSLSSVVLFALSPTGDPISGS